MEEKSLTEKKLAELENLKQSFSNLNLKNWELTSGNYNGSGGQAQVIEVRNKETKQIGIFRKLKDGSSETDINRFFQELEVLKKIDHPNIVKILDFTEDKTNYWYISKKGERFETYWKKYLKHNKQQPDKILEEAIRVLKELCSGLIPLHEKGIIHRDIKAKNIVINDSIPLLIDFGLVYITGEKRYTSKKDAVGNLFSPDPSLNFMKNVPPWLDVFLLSQLLIWMVSKGTNKPHVQRPMDWRWVIYPEFSSENYLKVRAITASCSNYYTSPQNASELKTLLDTLFNTNMNVMRNAESERIKKVLETVQKNTSAQIASFAEKRSIIESRFPLFISMCNDLNTSINVIHSQLTSAHFNIKTYPFFREEQKDHIDLQRIFFSESWDNKQHTYSTNTTHNIEKHPIALTASFNYTITLDNYSKGIYETLENRPYADIIIHSDKGNKLGRSYHYIIFPNDSGTLSLFDNKTNLLSDTTIEKIVKLYKDAILNHEMWDNVM